MGQTPVLHHRANHRDKITALGALSISPQRRRLNLYMHLYEAPSVQQGEVIVFLRDLQRHLPGRIVVIWDRLHQHRGKELRDYVAKCPRLTLEYLPPYAPELNPVEYLWSSLKAHRLANHGIPTIEQLQDLVVGESTAIRASQELLRSFVRHSPLSIRL